MSHSAAHHQELENELFAKTVLGFWIYLLTDFILFGVLFATYAVLANSTYGGPSSKDLFSTFHALIQTLILLTSSWTISIALNFAHQKKGGLTTLFFALSFSLGGAFIILQFNEFHQLLSQGFSWKSSAFLSAYFTLVGTLSAHLVIALLWIFVLILPVCYHGINATRIRRLTCLKLFWQFINIVWIFIFSFIYLVGGH